jgi:hypothetical protein
MFIAWEMPEGATFPEIEPSEPLVHEVHHALVFERYGKTMAVKLGVPHLLPAVEEGY